MIVHVTQDNIDAANAHFATTPILQQRRAHTCPVARGCLDAGFPENVCVGRTHIEVGHSHLALIDLPKAVSDRIRIYDHTGHMSPFSFEISGREALKIKAYNLLRKLTQWRR